MPQRLDVMRVAVVFVCLTSCSVNLSPPTDVEITCSGNAECPSGYHCSTQLARCVPDGQEDVPPRIIGLAAVVERASDALVVDAAAVGSTVRVHFTVDEALSDDPLVTLTWPDSDGYHREGRATLVQGVYEMVTTIDALDPSGTVSIAVVAVDLVGNVGNAELPRHFLVDTMSFLLRSATMRPRSPVPTELSAIGVAVTAVRNEAAGLPEVEAQVSFNKAPSQKPVIALAGPSGVVIPGIVSALAATSFVITFEIGDTVTTAPNGDVFELVITAHDSAGNDWQLAAAVTVPSIVVDTSPPDPPANLVFLRAPWGAGNALPERTFAVQAEHAGAVIGAAGSSDRLFVHDTPSGVRARLGVAKLASDGTLPGDQLTLATSDRLDVVASLVDAAGNEGDALRVAVGRWVATFKGRTTGNDFLNPNRLTRVSEAGDALFDPLQSEAATADIGNTVLSDGVSFVHSVRSGLWRFRRLGTPPPQVLGGGAYVPAGARVQLVGGLSADGIFSNMWDWDGQNWRELDLIGQLWPGESIGPSFAHDFARNRSVYHGGTVTLEPLQRTWEFDGTNWLDVTPTPPGPPAVFASMVFDPIAGVMVLHGAFEPAGQDGLCPATGQPPPSQIPQCVSTTTWLYDGSAWEAVACPAGGCPSARTLASMSYDPESGHVVLFGGTDTIFGGSTLFGDLWEWDTQSRTWTEITPTGLVWPSPRSAAVMSYMSAFGGVLIWGGCEIGGDVFDCARDGNPDDNIDQFLVWKGGAVTPGFVSVTVENPGGSMTPLRSRGVAQTAYIAARGELLVFGGARQLTAGEPSNNCVPNHPAACDGEDPRSSGGSGSERCGCDFTTGWTLQPTGPGTARWRSAAATTSVHSQSERFTMVYDQQAHRSVIFGGRLGGTGDCDGAVDNDASDRCHSMWTWDGISVRPGPLTAAGNIANNSACGNPANASPCGDSDQPATYLPGEKKVAFFDRPDGTLGPGNNNSGIWRYDVNGGVPVTAPVATTAASTPPMTEGYGIATAVDGVPDVVFLFGGVALGTCASLDARYGLAGVQSYGNELPNNQCQSRALWRWASAAGWQLFLPPIGQTNWPSPRNNASMVAVDGGAILLYGGCLQTKDGDCVAMAAGPVSSSDTWVMMPGPPTWSCLSGESCSGSGVSPPGPLSGAKLAWDSDAHRVLMFGGSEQEGPGPNTLWAWRQSTVTPPIQGSWSELVVDGARPLSRKRHALIYDTDRRVLVLAGEGRPGEIWEINLDIHNRPVLVFDFALRNAGLSEAPGVQRASDTVQRIRLLLDVVASGFDGPQVIDSLFIQLWNSPLGRWVDVGTPTGEGSVPVGTCNYDTDGARPGRQVVCDIVGADARALVFAGDDHVYARMAPAGGVGAAGEASTLALDAVRLEVDYALPP